MPTVSKSILGFAVTAAVLSKYTFAVVRTSFGSWSANDALPPASLRTGAATSLARRELTRIRRLKLNYRHAERLEFNRFLRVRIGEQLAASFGHRHGLFLGSVVDDE